MPSFHLPILSAALYACGAIAARNYMVQNNCPLPITWYMGNASQGVLATGEAITKTPSANFSSYIYTDVNGGNANGKGTTRAGFYVEDTSFGYYYAVVDLKVRFNVGIKIVPQVPVNGSFCKAYKCDQDCPSVYQSPPTSFPPHNGTAPQLPLYECDGEDISHKVTFCPDSTFPTSVPTTIHPNGNKNKCLDVRGAIFKNGTPVQIYDCNGSNAQKWTINAAGTVIKAGDTGSFCLDAGTNPANGVGMKIWQCYDNLPAQAWYYTADKRIAVTGKGQCLDLTDGSLTNSKQTQTWHCTTGDKNQIWTLGSQL